MSSHLTPVRMAVIQKSENSKYWKNVEKKAVSDIHTLEYTHIIHKHTMGNYSAMRNN